MADFSPTNERHTRAQLLATLAEVLRSLDARREHIAAAHVDSAINVLSASTLSSGAVDAPPLPSNRASQRPVNRPAQTATRPISRPLTLRLVKADG